MLSADETVVNPAHLRSFLQSVKFAAGSQHDAYPVVMNAGADFDSVRVARVDGGWRYVGRVHEYATNSIAASGLFSTSSPPPPLRILLPLLLLFQVPVFFLRGLRAGT